MGGLSRAADGVGVAVATDARRAAVVWIFGGTIWFVLEAIAAIAFPGYNYAHYYISDLGNPTREFFEGRLVDSRLAWVMNVDFVAHGLAFLVGALFAFRAAGRGITRYLFLCLVALNALGGFAVAAIHSSNHAVANDTEPLHGLAALISILGGDLAIIVAGIGSRTLGANGLYRTASVLLGAAAIASFVVLLGTMPHARLGSGVWERGSVYPIMLWEIATGFVIMLDARTLKRVRLEPLK